MEPTGYILHSDHSISSRVDYKTYRYFVERGLELGTYGDAQTHRSEPAGIKETAS